MLLSFERGAPDRPRGHALAYFKDATHPDDVYATYLVAPPIAIDLVKYMPPMFANKMSFAEMQSVSAIPLPPVPEKVAGLRFLQDLAERREDDIINLGVIDCSDVQRMLISVADAAQDYMRAVTSYMESVPVAPPERPEHVAAGESNDAASLSATVDDVMFSLMSDRDKLGELSKLVGKLRYAVEGNDKTLAEETIEEMEALGRHLHERYRVPEIIHAAKTAGPKGQTLSELHVSRCYKLSAEDFRAVEELELRIRQTEERG